SPSTSGTCATRSTGRSAERRSRPSGPRVTASVMTGFRRLPVRARLTAGFAAAMAAILVAVGLVLYFAMSAVLLDEIDTGLRSRAVTFEADLPGVLHLASPTRGLIESHEAFAQVVRRDNSVVETSAAFPH